MKKIYTKLLPAIIFCQLMALTANGQTFTSSNLPIVVINTNGQEIINAYKITADMGIIYNGEGFRNNLTDSCNNYKGKIGIEIRGSSSQMFPKKQYSVETRDIAGGDSSVSLLGFPKEADWILSAPYTDKTFMRDVIVYKLANEMGRYATRTKFCELVLNGDYMGVYILFEKIKRDKNRVNISKLDSTGVSGDQLTGGYIIKIDKRDGEGNAGWYSQYLPYSGSAKRILFQYHYPKPEDIIDVQKSYIQDFVYAFESAMYANNKDSLTGYPKYMDMDSFADYFLLNEFNKNVDSYRNSAFMYKDRQSTGGRLFMGPVWDFNLGFGNCDFYQAGPPQGWQFTYLTNDFNFLHNDDYQVPFWWKTLFNDPDFKNKVYYRWKQLKETVFNPQHINTIIDSCVALLGEATPRNYARWPILGTYVWPNYKVWNTYAEEIDYMKGFISTRYSWMNTQLTGWVTDVEQEDVNIDDCYLSQNYPNPFNPETTFQFVVKNEGLVTLKIYDVLGREAATVINEILKAGGHSKTFNASELSSGVYFYKLDITDKNNFSVTKKLILLK